MQYKEYLKSNDWRNKRSIKRSKQNRCAICASTEVLDVHHLNYKNLFDVDQSDLRVLCRECHFKAHDLMKAKKIWFKPNVSHHSKFTSIKNAVKKARGLGWGNLFYPTNRSIKIFRLGISPKPTFSSFNVIAMKYFPNEVSNGAIEKHFYGPTVLSNYNILGIVIVIAVTRSYFYK